MKRNYFKFLVSVSLCVGSIFSTQGIAAPVSGLGTWETTLAGRDLDGNQTTAEAYYDAVLGITWLADANYAMTTGYMDSWYVDEDGSMLWDAADTWVTNLNPYGSGIEGWRLPETNPVNGASYNLTLAYDGSTDKGYNISAPGTVYEGSQGSEIAHLYYNTLGNLGYRDTSGNVQAGSGLTNTGPFSNLMYGYYWSATEFFPSAPPYYDGGWYFHTGNGYQGTREKVNTSYAWAVHDGDVGSSVVLPVPAAVWLLGLGLLSLIGVARRKKTE